MAEAPADYDRTFERIQFVDVIDGEDGDRFQGVAAVHVGKAHGSDEVFVWRIPSPTAPPELLAGPFESVWEGYQWARRLRWGSHWRTASNTRPLPDFADYERFVADRQARRAARQTQMRERR